jgi:large repetitive protein
MKAPLQTWFTVDNFGNTFSVILNTAGTNVGLTSLANPSSFGDAATFRAIVRGSVLRAISPAGTITFEDAQPTLATIPLSNGTASLSISALSRGTHISEG